MDTQFTGRNPVRSMLENNSVKFVPVHIGRYFIFTTSNRDTVPAEWFHVYNVLVHLSCLLGYVIRPVYFLQYSEDIITFELLIFKWYKHRFDIGIFIEINNALDIT